jgi:hypothetical protein
MSFWEQISHSVEWIFSGIGVWILTFTCALIGAIWKWIRRKSFIGEVVVENYKDRVITLKQYKKIDQDFTEDDVVKESESIVRYNIEPVDPYKDPLSYFTRQSDPFRNQKMYESQSSIYLKSVNEYKQRIASSRAQSNKLRKINLNIANKGRISGENIDIELTIDNPKNLLSVDAKENVKYKRLCPPMNIGKFDTLCLPPQMEEKDYEITEFDFDKHPEGVIKHKVSNLNAFQSEHVVAFYVLLVSASKTVINWKVTAKNTKTFKGKLIINVE